MKLKIRTVIFDLDGTLSDSSVLTITAFNKIVPGYGLPVPSKDAIQRAMGHQSSEFYCILFPDSPGELVSRLGGEVDAEELRILPSFGERLLFDGCRELLVLLREHGLRLCIASTGAKDHVYSVLEGTGITGFFDRITCGLSDKTAILGEMTKDGNKNEYVMVGDMKKDYEAARANNIVSVGACYGYCKRELSDFDFYIDTPLELLEILKIKEA